MCACGLKPVTKVLSFDITGTLLRFRLPIGEIYHQAAVKVLQNPPSAHELNTAFRSAFKDALKKYPCYGFHANISERQWWFYLVSDCLQRTGKEYSSHTTEEFFRRVYQAFGHQDSFHIFDDTIPTLKLLNSRGYHVGVLTNSPKRTIEDTLPLLHLDSHFDWFVSSLDIGYDKPDKRIFDHTYEKRKKKLPTLRRDEILHSGDNYEADFLGARNAGFRCLLLGNCFFT